MKLSQALMVGAVVASAEALDLSVLRKSLPSFLPRGLDLRPRKSPSCPAVWSSVSSTLTGMFLDGNQCNDDARAAIREAFHDCGTWNKAQGSTGGCDGSLILANETSRPENNGLQDISAKLLKLANQFNVGVADMIQFAGAHAIVTCPGGPRIQTFVGRKDSSNPAPDGFLPDVHASGDSLFALFQDKGFSAVDLAALLGAHSTSKQVSILKDTGPTHQPLTNIFSSMSTSPNQEQLRIARPASGTSSTTRRPPIR